MQIPLLVTIILFGLWIVLLTSESNTISYFEANESERVEKIEWCKDSFGRLERSDCKNALEAEKRIQ